jgi:hypothetical protein
MFLMFFVIAFQTGWHNLTRVLSDADWDRAKVLVFATLLTIWIWTDIPKSSWQDS